MHPEDIKVVEWYAKIKRYKNPDVVAELLDDVKVIAETYKLEHTDANTGRFVSKETRLSHFRLTLVIRRMEDKLKELRKLYAKDQEVKSKIKLVLAKKNDDKKDVLVDVISKIVQTQERDKNRRIASAEQRLRIVEPRINQQIAIQNAPEIPMADPTDPLTIRALELIKEYIAQGADKMDAVKAAWKQVEAEKRANEIDFDLSQLKSGNLSDASPVELAPQLTGTDALDAALNIKEPEIESFKLPKLNIGGPDSNDPSSNNSRADNNQPDVKFKPQRPLTRAERIEAEAIAAAEARRSLGLVVEDDSTDGLGA